MVTFWIHVYHSAVKRSWVHIDTMHQCNSVHLIQIEWHCASCLQNLSCTHTLKAKPWESSCSLRSVRTTPASARNVFLSASTCMNSQTIFDTESHGNSCNLTQAMSAYFKKLIEVLEGDHEVGCASYIRGRMPTTNNPHCFLLFLC